MLINKLTKGVTRIFFLFTSLHSSVALFGQNNSVLEGQVLFSNEPLAYAHIYVEGTIFGTVTNELGYFVLNLPDAKDITIVISEIGFKTRKLDLIDFPKDGIIELKQDTYRLDEVVINSSKLMMNDPFGEALNAIKTNYPRKWQRLEGFYREVSFIDTSFTRLIEAKIAVKNPAYSKDRVDEENFQLSGNLTEILQLRKTVDNREYDLFGTLFKRFFGEINDIEALFYNDYVRFFTKKRGHVLSKEGMSELDLKLDSLSVYEGDTVYNMSAKIKHNGLFNHVFNFHINKNDKAFIKIDYTLFANHRNENIRKKFIDQKYIFRGVIKYQKTKSEFYVPFYIKSIKYASNTNPLVDDGLQITISEFLLNNFYPKSRSSNIKRKHAVSPYQDIYKYNAKYDEDFWGDYNIVKQLPYNNKIDSTRFIFVD